jgi:predicted enzyme related to lactoylglutathione lyase
MKQIESRPVKAGGFDFVMFLAQDMKRARAFYESLLSLTPRDFDSENFVEYDLPDGNTFAIGRNPGAPHTPLGGIMFGVEDAEAARNRVEALGGKLIANFGGARCTTAWCTDTEGNAFGLHQRK